MTKASIFSKQDHTIAEILVSIIYTNPFRPKRAELNQRFFELASPQLEHHVYAPISDELSYNQNIQSYLHISKSILDRTHQKLQGQYNTSEKEINTYEHLVYFYLFHALLPSIDLYIETCLNNPNKNPRWTGFSDLLELYERYFSINGERLKTTYSTEELASFCFQIRRAFFHTYHTIKGNSMPIHALRARVWDSVFTHNTRRYLRSLYYRMSDIYTLITGPSGSGKEVVARCIGLSRFIPFDPAKLQFERNFTESFYPINLSALSSTLIESELFGHKKGAFTGALQDKQGYFESSGAYGTVFLDEIGDTDPSIQIKLLRVLQTRQFQRLGETQTLPFQGKVMAATNIDLIRAIESGQFREDFYYRLCADQIETPSLQTILSDNSDELNNLIHYICVRFAGAEESDQLFEESISWISKNMPRNYEWPGNFRELEQCVRNIMIQGEYHPHSINRNNTNTPVHKIENGAYTLEQLTEFYIKKEYHRTPRYAEVAQRLAVDPRTIKKYVQQRSKSNGE